MGRQVNLKMSAKDPIYLDYTNKSVTSRINIKESSNTLYMYN